jgi:DNA polymerase III sliding clamp (beta) subunit (PCNA family)
VASGLRCDISFTLFHTWFIMLTLSRRILRQFKTLARKAGIKSLRSMTRPEVLLTTTPQDYQLSCGYDSVQLIYEAQEPLSDTGSWPIDWSLIEQTGSPQEGLVTLLLQDKSLEANWSDKQVPQRKQFTVYPQEKVSKTLTTLKKPTTWHSLPMDFWEALSHAVPCCDHESSRYALGCIQLRGQHGELAATDGRQIYLHGGWQLPFEDTLLIPGNAILGCKELAQQESVQIALTTDALWFQLGSWSIRLVIDQQGRFPDIYRVIPAAEKLPTKLILTESDAQFLLNSLDALPGQAEQYHPVTLELNGHVAIRGRADQANPPTELILSQSQRQGAEFLSTMNREYLAKALKLGFREFKFGSTNTPVLCQNGHRTYLFAMLDDKSAIPTTATALRIESSQQPASVAIPKPLSKPQLVMPKTTPRFETKPITTPAPVPTSATPKPLEAAALLRDTLRTALQQTSELITSLKRQKQQSKLMQSTLASLKQLQQVA